MSTEVKIDSSPADIVTRDTRIVPKVPKFESILNSKGLSAILENPLSCVQCQTCVRCCIGCNIVPEGGQPDNLISEKLSVGSVRSAGILIR